MRLAPKLDSYPPIKAGFREEDLIDVVRVEYCACGTWVRQLAGDTITDTIRRHNRTMQHQNWRLSQ